MDMIDRFVDKTIDKWWKKKKFPLKGNGRTRYLDTNKWWCDWVPQRDKERYEHEASRVQSSSAQDRQEIRHETGRSDSGCVQSQR